MYWNNVCHCTFLERWIISISDIMGYELLIIFPSAFGFVVAGHESDYVAQGQMLIQAKVSGDSCR